MARQVSIADLLKLHITVPLNRQLCFASTVSVAGAKWKEHRKLFTPAFHFKILEDFVEVFGSKDRILIEKLEKHVNGPAFDIRPYISLYTLDIICGKHNVSLVTGAQHVLWHIIMK
jgi:cytochrome P450